MSVTVKYDRRASNTEAFAILAEAWNEMVQDGYTPDNVGTPPINPETEVIYAISKDGDIVGVLAWQHDVQNAAYVVSLAYVEPSSRKQGVFREMFKALCARAYSVGVSKIVSVVHVKSPGVEVFRRVGGSPVSVTYEQIVS